MITVCFHGVESTGKSVLAARLAAQHGWPWVPEYGRTYCEEHGTDLAMDDLIAIADGQAALVQRASAENPPLLILDTDQLMTAAWAQMLFGTVPRLLMGYPKADLYLNFAADVPWIDDGTRFFGTAQARSEFARIADNMLATARVRTVSVSGDWPQREAAVRRAIETLVAQA